MAHEHHHHECSCSEHHHKHEHHHDHEHHHEESPRGQLITILAAAALLAVAVAIEHTFVLPMWQLLLIYLVPYLIVGWGTLREAVEGLMEGEAFNEHFLMAIATLGALGIGFLPGAEHEFPEAVFVMLFFQVGELFEGYAEGKSRESISHLMNIRTDVAHVVSESTEVNDVRPEDVMVGATILVRVGEKIPLDGVVVEGNSELNTIALTGERYLVRWRLATRWCRAVSICRVYYEFGPPRVMARVLSQR